MGTVDISKATQPERHLRDGSNSPRARHFAKNLTETAKRHIFIRRQILFQRREAPVNPARAEIDAEASARLVKDLVLEMGASIVGIAAYDPRFTFKDAEELSHDYVIVFGMPMRYDLMADIGPRSQDEVHRVYYQLDDIGVRLTHHIGAMGYNALLQHNHAEIPLVPYAYLAGLGELGKHGSLISPELGSSFRLSAVSTNLPLTADGPQDFKIEEFCASCDVCTRFCPGDAIRPEKSEVAGVTRWYVDTPACEPYFYQLYGCKICLMVCPFNGQGSMKETYQSVVQDIVATKDAEGMLKLLGERTEIEGGDVDFTHADKSDPYIPGK